MAGTSPAMTTRDAKTLQPERALLAGVVRRAISPSLTGLLLPGILPRALRTSTGPAFSRRSALILLLVASPRTLAFRLLPNIGCLRMLDPNRTGRALQSSAPPAHPGAKGSRYEIGRARRLSRGGGHGRHLLDAHHDPAARRRHRLQPCLDRLRPARRRLSAPIPAPLRAAAERGAAAADDRPRAPGARRLRRRPGDELAEAVHVRAPRVGGRGAVPQGRRRRPPALHGERALPPARERHRACRRSGGGRACAPRARPARHPDARMRGR